MFLIWHSQSKKLPGTEIKCFKWKIATLDVTDRRTSSKIEKSSQKCTADVLSVENCLLYLLMSISIPYHKQSYFHKYVHKYTKSTNRSSRAICHAPKRMSNRGIGKWIVIYLYNRVHIGNKNNKLINSATYVGLININTAQKRPDSRILATWLSLKEIEKWKKLCMVAAGGNFWIKLGRALGIAFGHRQCCMHLILFTLWG